MQLKLIRKVFNDNNIIGELYIDGAFFCHTLEDIERTKKVLNQTCIPCGNYTVILSESTRFKRILPEVLNVLGFIGIRIHNGNTEADTSGCILIGYKTDNKKIWESVKATNDLVDKLTGADKITLTITE
jgi:hypothetical protein